MSFTVHVYFREVVAPNTYTLSHHNARKLTWYVSQDTATYMYKSLERLFANKLLDSVHVLEPQACRGALLFSSQFTTFEDLQQRINKIF